MAIFDRLDRMASRVVDRTFARSFVCYPVESAPNGRPIADQSREAWHGRGILDERPAWAGVEIGSRDRAGNDLRTLVHNAEFELSVDRAAHPAASTVRQRDRIHTTDGRAFDVVGVKPDGARVVLQLVEVSPPRRP